MPDSNSEFNTNYNNSLDSPWMSLELKAGGHYDDYHSLFAISFSKPWISSACGWNWLWLLLLGVWRLTLWFFVWVCFHVPVFLLGVGGNNYGGLLCGWVAIIVGCLCWCWEGRCTWRFSRMIHGFVLDKGKPDHIIPLLDKLHWLPVKFHCDSVSMTWQPFCAIALTVHSPLSLTIQLLSAYLYMY